MRWVVPARTTGAALFPVTIHRCRPVTARLSLTGHSSPFGSAEWTACRFPVTPLLEPWGVEPLPRVLYFECYERAHVSRLGQTGSGRLPDHSSTSSFGTAPQWLNGTKPHGFVRCRRWFSPIGVWESPSRAAYAAIATGRSNERLATNGSTLPVSAGFVFPPVRPGGLRSHSPRHTPVESKSAPYPCVGFPSCTRNPDATDPKITAPPASRPPVGRATAAPIPPPAASVPTVPQVASLSCGQIAPYRGQPSR